MSIDKPDTTMKKPSLAQRLGLSFVDTVELQMEFVVPLLRDLQAVLGEEVVLQALEERNRRTLEQVRETQAEPVRVVDTKILRDLETPAEGGALAYSVEVIDDDHMNVKVDRCRMAEIMQTMDASDLGYLLLCAADYAAVARTRVNLDRPQTRMQGGSCCDFRFSSDV